MKVEENAAALSSIITCYVINSEQQNTVEFNVLLNNADLWDSDTSFSEVLTLAIAFQKTEE